MLIAVNMHVNLGLVPRLSGFGASVVRFLRPAMCKEICKMTVEDRITIDPSVRGGKPCIKGTRITVYDLLEYLAGGMSEEQILSDFPSLVRENVREALVFAALRERRLASSPTA
jgi:uncharacterized protein (DUF433 family)